MSLMDTIIYTKGIRPSLLMVTMEVL